MTIKDLIAIYDKYKRKYGQNAYRHVSEILRKAKKQHRKDFTGNDHEQSWHAFKGRNLEKLIEYILVLEVEKLGLKILNGNSLEKTNEVNLSEYLVKIKRNLIIDYGEFGYHLPDIDMVIYDVNKCKVIAVISSKVTLRERIAHTGYWKIKLAGGKLTKHIKVYFITLDEDQTLKHKYPSKKGRAIVETDTDGGYVLSENNIEESDKVKMFDKFIDDLKNTINDK
ncbi:MAG: BsaWI family type II restriction enzyme [Elusimicrobiota bacterium]|jgi:type II restriction enzyme|nr:BsaWI family type II restriction enzyme [Elusimicrobiota bacterium]